MTRDRKTKIIGTIIMIPGLAIIGYLVISKNNSITLSIIAGLLTGMGYGLIRKGETIIEHLKKKHATRGEV